MTDDRGQHLTSMEGLTHELFGGDPEEIVLRAAQVGEGARTLADLAGALRTEADRYERLQRDGWRLAAPFRGGEGRCRKTAQPGEAPDRAAARVGAPAEHLPAVVEGAARLPDAAARLRAAAAAYDELAGGDRRLTGPVTDGHVPLG